MHKKLPAFLLALSFLSGFSLPGSALEQPDIQNLSYRNVAVYAEQRKTLYGAF